MQRRHSGHQGQSVNADDAPECLSHLAATISILQPTLVISQGKTVSPPLRGLFDVEKEHSPTLAACSLNGRRFVWADLFHPTYHWDWLARPYLQQVVEPTLIEARRLALELAASFDGRGLS
jgi:hypothetical protein